MFKGFMLYNIYLKKIGNYLNNQKIGFGYKKTTK